MTTVDQGEDRGLPLSAQVHGSTARPTPPTGASAGPRPEVPRAGRLITAYAVFVMVLGTGAFTALTETDLQTPVFALWALAYLVAVAGLFDDRFRRRLVVGAPVVLVVVLALTAVSVGWSVDPGLTLRRSVGLVGTALVGLFLTRRLRPVQLLDVLRLTVLLLALASLLLFATGSTLALDPVHGTLRGVLVTKNTLGRTLALGILAAAAVALLDRRRTRRALLSAVPMVLALSLTASTGGMVLTVAVVAVVATLALWGTRRGPRLLLGGVALVLAAASLIAPRLSAETVAGAIGEDVTLTGRTDIWAAALQAIADRPLLGHGYGAFWEGSTEALRIQSRLQWEVPNAHNGVLDVGLDLGLVGIVLVLVLLAGLVLRGFGDLRAARPDAAFLRLAVAGITISANLVETGLLQQNTLYTVLLVAALAAGPARRAEPLDLGGPVLPAAVTSRARAAATRLGGALRGRSGRAMSWAMVGQLTALVASTANFLLLARLVGPAQYGLIAGSWALVLAVCPLALLGADRLVVRDVNARGQRPAVALGSALLTCSVGWVVVVAALLALQPLVLPQVPLLLLAFLAVADIVALGASVVVTSLCYATGNARAAGISVVVLNAAKLLSVLTFAAVGDGDPVRWAAIYAALTLIAATGQVTFAVRRFGRPSTEGYDLRTRAREGLPYTGSVVAGIVQNDADKILLVRHGLTVDAGHYSVAYRLSSMAYVPVQAVLQAMFPRFFAVGGDGDLGATVALGRRMLRPLLAYGLVATLGLLIITPLVPVLIGEEYRDSAPLLMALAPLVLLRVVHTVTGDMLTGAGRQHARTLCTATTAGVNVVLNLALIPVLGVVGAVIATYAAHLLLCVLLVTVVRRGLRGPAPTRSQS